MAAINSLFKKDNNGDNSNGGGNTGKDHKAPSNAAPEYPPKSKQTTQQENAVFDSNTVTLYYSSLVNTAPFKDFSEAFNKTLGGTVLGTTPISRDGVINSKITTTNYYYQIKNSTHNRRGRLNGEGAYYSNYIKTKEYRNGSGTNTYRNNPYWSAIPNCVGAMRGRYQELQQKYVWSIPSTEPSGYLHALPWSNTPNKTLFGTFKLWEDVDGTYGPKGGLWGKYKAKTGAPPIPGCLVIWPYARHVAFCEALYNYGKPDEYIITTESCLGQFSPNQGGYYYLAKRKRGMNKNNPYPWNSSTETWFLYTPLCNFDVAESLVLTSEGYDSEGNIDDKLEDVYVNYTDPIEDQVENYEKLVKLLHGAKITLKVGDRVKIYGWGYKNKNATGGRINKLGMCGYVNKIYSSGLPSPYKIVDKPTNGSLIGYFDRNSIELANL